jgi:hypothetical protein
MDVDQELEDLAACLEGDGWRTKPQSQWTPAERRAYERWAAEQLTDWPKTSRPVNIRVRTRDDPEEIGEVVRFTLTFDRVRREWGTTETHYSPERS